MSVRVQQISFEGDVVVIAFVDDGDVKASVARAQQMQIDRDVIAAELLVDLQNTALEIINEARALLHETPDSFKSSVR